MTRGLLALLALVIGATPRATAQAPPPAKLAASVKRLFGPGTRVDSIRVDSTTVLRVSRRDSLLGFAQVGNVIGKDQPITFLVARAPTIAPDVDILVLPRAPRGRSRA
jgi:hypothetical protein